MLITRNEGRVCASVHLLEIRAVRLFPTTYRALVQTRVSINVKKPVMITRLGVGGCLSFRISGRVSAETFVSPGKASRGGVLYCASCTDMTANRLSAPRVVLHSTVMYEPLTCHLPLTIKTLP